MDPWLVDLVDWHGRRHGAPAELVAVHGMGASTVIAESFDTDSLHLVPATHLTLTGQMGGALVERTDHDLTITLALAGGVVERWVGTPGRLEPTASSNGEPTVLAWLWGLLDPTSNQLGQVTFAEVAGRVLLDAILTDAIERHWCEPLADSLTAFRHGDLAALARLAGAPRPTSRVDGSYVRGLMAHFGWRRIPPPAGDRLGSLRALHRRAPYRWQLAADVRDVLGDADAARALLWAPTRWLESTT